MTCGSVPIPTGPNGSELTFTAPSTTPALLCWNCGITLSQICSLSETSVALYRANVDRIAILPHSEHSFNATSSFVKVGPSMMKSDWFGRADGGGEERPGEEGGEAGRASEASWISARAATALATT